MVGGRVIEVCEVKDRPDVLFVDVRDKNDTCAIYVEKNAASLLIEIGDSLWWQSGWAMWTPQKNLGVDPAKGIHDVQIKKIGYSGVKLKRD